MQPLTEKNRMNLEEIYALLDRCNEGVLSTVGPDGYPYGVPVNYVRIGNTIYIHGRPAGDKVDNLESRPKACFTVMEVGGFERTGPDGCNTTTVYESAIVRGTAEKVEGETEKTAVLKALIAKLVPERIPDGMDAKAVQHVAVYGIKIENATGKYHRPRAGDHRAD